MKKQALLLKHWNEALENESWYPPFADALADITAEQARWKPEQSSVNSIWESVVHLLWYKERLLQRIKGKPDTRIHSNDETFVVRGSTEDDWQQTVTRLFRVHRELAQLLKNATAPELDNPPAGPDSDVPLDAQYFTLTVHDAYHTGQIMFIRKLLKTWPDHRSFAE
ncbi:MAG: DinB family protein [Candidatus Pseudobacter hemicellulosilyticus]|uniref:DinB family protein n=1 Tax=Candidatus Pseudobacter hemicellulosilyticus TaxID=3121375 RepID=A0AAJ5WPI7_9BACT|nr:MAG: DinB family protein [Pseudobacter sp.]